MPKEDFLNYLTKLEGKRDPAEIKKILIGYMATMEGEPNMFQTLASNLDSINPLTTDGRLNKKSWLFSDSTEEKSEPFEKAIEAHASLFRHLSQIYTDTFSPYLTYQNYAAETVSQFLDALIMWVLGFKQFCLYEEQKVHHNLKEELDSFKSLFELNLKLFTIVAKGVHREREHRELVEENPSSAKNYLFRLSKRFQRLFYRTLRKEFRDGFAHEDWIETDDTHFYFLKKPTRVFSRDDLDKASLDLLLFLIFSFVIFLLNPIKQFIRKIPMSPS